MSRRPDTMGIAKRSGGAAAPRSSVTADPRRRAGRSGTTAGEPAPRTQRATLTESTPSARRAAHRTSTPRAHAAPTTANRSRQHDQGRQHRAESPTTAASTRRSAATAAAKTARPKPTAQPAARPANRAAVRLISPSRQPAAKASTADNRRRRTIRTVRADRPDRHLFKAGQSRRRLIAVFVFAVVVFSVVLGKVVLLQTTGADALREAGRAQRTSETILKAHRGVIFDRHGDELAMSVPARTVIANPKLVVDATATVATLTQVLGLSAAKQQSLTDAFTTRDKSFLYVARQVSDEQAQAIAALDINGIDTIAEDRRTMPTGEVGKSVIGRTDPDGRGTAGIEKQYNALLTGIDGERVRQHDREGRSLPGSEATTVNPSSGNDLVLTVDRSVQYAVEQAMLAQVSQLMARGGTAVVLETKTGNVIAMVGVRRDDTTGEYAVTSGNIAAVDAAEPGSVVKVATIAAALNEGGVTPETVIEVPWSKQYSDTVLHDAEEHPTTNMSVREILTKSSNIGTIETMLRMGPNLRTAKEKLYSYLRAFGLGEKTALDFPGESRGMLKDWKQWEGAEQFTLAYGQGLASTSIQLASAINVLANNGMYVAPRLLAATISADGTITNAPPSETHRVVRPEVAQQLNAVMRQVVCNGTATRAKVDGLTIAGKTGTGLKAQANGTYLDADGNRTYYASFVGFFPAEDPQATVLISIDEPPGAEGQLTRFGGTAAAPVFAQVAPTIMREMGITPPGSGGGCPAG